MFYHNCACGNIIYVFPCVYCGRLRPIVKLYLTSKLSNVEIPIELLTLDQLRYIVK